MNLLDSPEGRKLVDDLARDLAPETAPRSGAEEFPGLAELLPAASPAIAAAVSAAAGYMAREVLKVVQEEGTALIVAKLRRFFERLRTGQAALTPEQLAAVARHARQQAEAHGMNSVTAREMADRLAASLGPG